MYIFLFLWVLAPQQWVKMLSGPINHCAKLSSNITFFFQGSLFLLSCVKPIPLISLLAPCLGSIYWHPLPSQYFPNPLTCWARTSTIKINLPIHVDSSPPTPCSNHFKQHAISFVSSMPLLISIPLSKHLFSPPSLCIKTLFNTVHLKSFPHY